MSKSNISRNKQISNSQFELRETLFPKIKEAQLWNRKKQTGFTTIPRTMPLILSIVTCISGSGVSAAKVYFDLWSRVFDESFVTLNKQEEMAFTSGFTGQRRLQTWRTQIDILQKLGFIKLAEGPNGPRSYALILNPHKVIRAIHAKDNSRIPKELFNTLASRAMEVKARDFSDGYERL
jgi:hypothetical protein